MRPCRPVPCPPCPPSELHLKFILIPLIPLEASRLRQTPPCTHRLDSCRRLVCPMLRLNNHKHLLRSWDAANRLAMLLTSSSTPRSSLPRPPQERLGITSSAIATNTTHRMVRRRTCQQIRQILIPLVYCLLSIRRFPLVHSWVLLIARHPPMGHHAPQAIPTLPTRPSHHQPTH